MDTQGKNVWFWWRIKHVSWRTPIDFSSAPIPLRWYAFDSTCLLFYSQIILLLIFSFESQIFKPGSLLQTDPKSGIMPEDSVRSDGERTIKCTCSHDKYSIELFCCIFQDQELNSFSCVQCDLSCQAACHLHWLIREQEQLCCSSGIYEIKFSSWFFITCSHHFHNMFHISLLYSCFELNAATDDLTAPHLTAPTTPQYTTLTMSHCDVPHRTKTTGAHPAHPITVPLFQLQSRFFYYYSPAL